MWGWIPFEEDHTKGKDRPSLVIGKDGAWVLVLMLTSKDHIPGGIGEVRTDGAARWMNIGGGAWDSQGRPSEVRLDRIIRLDPRGIRREGAVMDRSVFDLVAPNSPDAGTGSGISAGRSQPVSLSTVSSSWRVSRRGRVKMPSDAISSECFPAETKAVARMRPHDHVVRTRKSVEIG
ncbi:hypothetical protein IOD13_08170 [Brevibacterium casei]|nr:hypothetical protein [Brevibacterium casei]